LDGVTASNFTVTGAAENLLLSVAGGGAQELQLQSAGTGATAINMDATAGGIEIDAAAAQTVDVEVGAAGTLLFGNDAVAQTISVGTGAAAKTVTVGNQNTTSALVLDSGTGDIVITSTDLLDANITNAITIDSSAAGISLDGVTASNFTVTGAAENLLLSVAGGGAQELQLQSAGTGATAINMDATGAGGGVAVNTADGAVAVTAAGAANGDITISAGDVMDVDSVDALSINSSAGVINIGDDVVAQAINVGTGGARTITIGNVTGATAVNINTGTGGSLITTTGAGDFAVNSADTLLLDSAGVLELNSSAGAISIGNDAVAQKLTLGELTTRTETEMNGILVDINGGTGGVTIDGGAASHFATSLGDLSLEAQSANGQKITLDAYHVIDNPSGQIVFDSGSSGIDANLNTGIFAIDGGLPAMG
jgi:hypothetical protein